MGLNQVSNADYHGDKDYLSSSNLKLILKDRERFYREKILGDREDRKSTAFDEGSLTHAMILEPHMVDKEFAFYPGWRKQGKQFDTFLAGNQDKIIISKPQKFRCEKYVEAFNNNKVAKSLVSGGEAEHTICGEIDGVKVKIRADYINVEKGYILDVKTTGYSADLDSFKMSMEQFGYTLSGALYLKVAEQHYNRDFEFLFGVISKRNFNTEVYRMSDETRARGEHDIAAALNIYKECKKTGNWENPALDLNNLEVIEDYEIMEV
jgi:hypothetical protein